MEEVAASISDQKTPSRTTQRDRFKCDFCNYHGKREGLVQHVKGKADWEIAGSVSLNKQN